MMSSRSIMGLTLLLTASAAGVVQPDSCEGDCKGARAQVLLQTGSVGHRFSAHGSGDKLQGAQRLASMSLSEKGSRVEGLVNDTTTTAAQDGNGSRTIPAAAAARVWEVKLSSFAQDVARNVAQFSAVSPPTVALSVTNIRYKERWEEMALSVGSIANISLAIVALDQATQEYFEAKKIPCIYMNLMERKVTIHPWMGSKANAPRAPVNEAVMRAKYEVPYALLQAGLRVLFLEMDVNLKKDPLVFDGKLTGDFLVSQHIDIPEINIGFWIAKPTPSMIHVFGRLVNWVNLPSRYDFMRQECNGVGCTSCTGCGWGCLVDQRVFDFAVKGSQSCSVMSCGFPQRDQQLVYDVGSTALRWSFIPVARFQHWGALHPGPDVVGVHIWSGAGPPAKQMQLAYALGYWFPGSPPPPGDPKIAPATTTTITTNNNITGGQIFP
ncbi:unnamed protein product [Polarella glacialis]|uniref:Nucleotide-diphospho-sugar transferase domain-containing protein n=1 Tax=Polarella glacialis TaxID=89957 RepID=A0A813HD05_POLGL|nr:unnamed protein product [Polarella glacialis]